MSGSKARLYMDYNASAPLRPQAYDAMLAALLIDANPSSVHTDGRAARSLVDQSRQQIDCLFGGQAKQMIFTSGATEAANFVLTPDWTMGRAPVRFSKLYVAASAHPCLLSGGRFAFDDVVQVPVTEHGTVDLIILEDLLDRHDAASGMPLVAMPAACNETGVMQPLTELASLVRAKGGTLVVDAVQMAGRLPIDLSNPAGDYFILSAHKLGGPRGIGALVALSDLMMPRPLITGGGQEKGHRAGTENTVGIAGFGAAVQAALIDMAEERWADTVVQRDRFEAELRMLCPSAIIHGDAVQRLPNTSFFSLPGIKAETAQIALDLDGIAVSAGSACSSGKVGPSHVLEVMNAERVDGALRVSLGLDASDADIDRLLQSLQRLLKRSKTARAA
ncbi:cysteine desulfurase family protein [Notoacmeibacter sp. MSK16QG-6]|uniref:cysteine desulfurase family protein n=1 Tax=Notoacmeibacter sp. MSK16QG-6 TaxID=2957982 RepID=UPI00209D80FD|nr:cysteine desulfurase family protein [Notoacmeibacter sp. MSK16QG-6]MCP1197833.1 cysteine desulfurase [Notoacmeibacter sp. MSK16QG-6]